MRLVTVIAILTAIVSVAVKVIGMPDQIKSNFRRKSTDGLSGWFITSTLISYMMWVIYGLITRNMTLIIGQGLGVIATSIILWQVVAYRKISKKSAKSKTVVLRYLTLFQRTKAQITSKPFAK
jgi:uncharacterized protein with PQ loop repeat